MRPDRFTIKTQEALQDAQAPAERRLRSRPREILRGLIALIVCGATPFAWAEELTFSAKVDKTSVKMGEPLQLTLTLSGDIAGVELPALQFPDGLTVAARSQATNVSIRGGAAERSMSLHYVLVPQQGGTFQLGPFSIEHAGKTLPTQPIEITVEKPAVPPQLTSPGGRHTL